MCRRTGLTRQNYYARRRQRQRRQVDGEMVAELVRKERRIQPRLGVRKLRILLKDELAEAGVQLGRDRFFQELRQRDLLVKRRRSEHAHTTNSRHGLPIFRNLIKDREITKPNEVWVGDLTYVRTEQNFLYLALLTDKHSRQIVGFHCGDTLEAIGCIKALEMALENLPKGAQPIHHTDRGCQYCCHDYARKLQERGMAMSMTETNHTAENALAERVNGILKTEYGLGGHFATKEEARRVVEEGIHLYNTRRPHMSLGYRIPEMVHSLSA